jgi:hypothetical protein
MAKRLQSEATLGADQRFVFVEGDDEFQRIALRSLHGDYSRHVRV